MLRSGGAMPSPFPGMNPYLEQDDVWQDCHQSLLPAMREVLTAQLDEGYVVKVEAHLFVHELPAEERRFLGRADVGVSQGLGNPRRDGASAVDAPAHGRVALAVDV